LLYADATEVELTWTSFALDAGAPLVLYVCSSVDLGGGGGDDGASGVDTAVRCSENSGQCAALSGQSVVLRDEGALTLAAWKEGLGTFKLCIQGCAVVVVVVVVVVGDEGGVDVFFWQAQLRT
jgi:hypothetical protein